MSAISREEIEREARMKFSTYYALQRAGLKDDYFIPGVVEFAERVAALVEERMREMVCSICGEPTRPDPDGPGRIHWPPLGGDRERLREHFPPGEKGWGGITRAQYEAEKEGR